MKEFWKNPVSRLNLVLAYLVIAVAFAYGINQGSHIDRIERNSERISRNEQRDANRVYRASYRICARANLTRAQIHLYFFERRRQLRKDLLRVQKTLPILDCKPNLVGRPAAVISAAKQRDFVKQYVDGKLDPTPE